jgi:predicted lipid carrier protein YhbT
MAGRNDELCLPTLTRILPPFSGLPLGPLLTLSLRSLARRRPGMFDRLGTHRRARYLIDPTDLPFAFLMVPDGASAVVRAVGKGRLPPSDVIVRGPILVLLGILEGTLDGDALFFHRALSVSGRTEALVALRNAIEDAELRPSDWLGLTGSLGRLVDAGVLGGLHAARQMVAGLPARPRAEA